MAEKEISTGLVVTLSIIAVIVFTILITVGWWIGTYNKFVIANQDMKTQWGNVKTEYQRRGDLIYNMAEIAQSYAKFEKSTMVEVTKARGGNFGTTQKDEMKNMASFDSALSRLLVTFEQYPQLKAIEQYNKLTEELQRTENRVQIARSDYNSVVRSYNILIQRFPANILSGIYGYKEADLFDSQPETEDGVKLNMGGN